jgi:hypothetical protein
MTERHAMAQVVHLNFPTALLGRWRSDEDDARSEYNISIERGSVKVSGIDYLDHEQYTISNVTYDAEQVEFDTFMHSTGRQGHLVLRKSSVAGKAEMRFTFTDISTAVKVSD